MKKSTLFYIGLGILAVALFLAGCGNDQSNNASENPDDHEHETAGELYTCGMHPQIVQEGPGQCPICAMDLTPMNATVSADGIVEIDPVTIQNIGVRTGIVTVAPLQNSIRTTGRFEMNAAGRRTVSLKVGGWIEKLYARYDGQIVRAGEPLFEIYSPELVATQADYLLAVRNAEKFESGLAAQDAQRLLAASRRRLSYWDLSDAQIKAIESAGEPLRTIRFDAPVSGEIMMNKLSEGQKVSAGQALLEIVDQSEVWLNVDVYEQDLAWISEGTTARIELPYDESKSWEGKVAQIYYMLNENSRAAQARIELPNDANRTLRPGMYATVLIEGAPSEPTPLVPSEALLRTGERNVVVVALGDGRFRPVEVEIGMEAGDQIQITDGLAGGEKIVTSAQFLIDSEARLKSAVGAMLGGHNHGGGVSEEDTSLPNPSSDPAMDGADEHAGHDMSSGEMSSSNMSAERVDVREMDKNGDDKVFLCTTNPMMIADSESELAECTGAVEETSIGLAHAYLADAGHQNTPVNVEAFDHNHDGTVYECPMDWSIITDHEGNCELCNMRLTAYSVDETKQNLIREGFGITE